MAAGGAGSGQAGGHALLPFERGTGQQSELAALVFAEFEREIFDCFAQERAAKGAVGSVANVAGGNGFFQEAGRQHLPQGLRGALGAGRPAIGGSNFQGFQSSLRSAVFIQTLPAGRAFGQMPTRAPDFRRLVAFTLGLGEPVKEFKGEMCIQLRHGCCSPLLIQTLFRGISLFEWLGIG
jgi:hypothetical protein